MGWSAHEVPVQTLILTVTTWCPDISAQDMLCKCGMKGRTDIRTDGWVGWWLYVGAPQGPSVKSMRNHVCHLPAVTEVSVENLFCGLCVLPTPTASSDDPDARRGCRVGAGQDAEYRQAAGQRRAAEYQMLLPASASESASPWQLALPDAPWTQDRHCSPATVIAASLAGGTDIFSRFRASLETGSLTSELHPAQALSLQEQVACFKVW